MVPFGVVGHDGHGVLLRAAASEAPPPDLLAQIDTLFGLGPARRDALRYNDPQRGQHRAMGLVRVADDTRLQAFVLGGDVSAEAWIKALLQDRQPAQAYGRLLLGAQVQPPVPPMSRGRQICTCFNVAETAIAQCLENSSGSAEQRLATLQQTLQCGTNCGSCLPALKRLVNASAATLPVV